jgi:putative ABC transport system permease protein
LVGFSVSSIQRRVKEIGVRKVNGAGEWSIVLLLNRRFLLKSFLALLIFSPLSWWLISTWLNNYAYHVHIRPGTIAALLLLILGVVFTTILLAVWNIVKRNPVEALRYE